MLWNFLEDLYFLIVDYFLQGIYVEIVEMSEVEAQLRGLFDWFREIVDFEVVVIDDIIAELRYLNVVRNT